MQLTDEQIMLLEQLTYLEDKVAREAGVVLGPYDSVESLLRQFDEDALAELEDSDEQFEGLISGKQWAAIIRQIQDDPELYSLDIAGKDDSVPAICFTDPNDPDSALVAFKGTTGQKEWQDNGSGFGLSDTEKQKEALEYIENLPYDSITVTGHSKGGNKAQYVTVLSDKVDRCISMDGQGFSQEFLDKYYAEIEKKGGCIKNYFLDGDFVSILLFPVPGSDQICIEGDDSIVLEKNHVPSSFYRYYQDEDGHWHILENGSGDSALVIGTREEVMVYLHEFTVFLLNVMPEEDKRKAGDYIGNILAILMESKDLELEDKTYNKSNIKEYLLSDQEMLTKLLAYFIKYVETYNLTDEEIRSLAEVLGLDEVLAVIEGGMAADNKTLGKVISDAGGLLNLIINQIRDGKEDPVIEWLLKWIGGWESEEVGQDMVDFWRSLEKEYQSIPDFDPEKARTDAAGKESKIRDFSERTYGILMSAIQSVEADTYGSVSGWSRYAGEEWYDTLLIPNAVGGINAYFERVSEINNACRAGAERVFDEANQADRKNAERLRSVIDELKSVRSLLEKKTDNLGRQ